MGLKGRRVSCKIKNLMKSIFDSMEEYEYREFPNIQGNAVQRTIEKWESEGWELHEIRGSRTIYKRKING